MIMVRSVAPLETKLLGEEFIVNSEFDDIELRKKSNVLFRRNDDGGALGVVSEYDFKITANDAGIEVVRV